MLVAGVDLAWGERNPDGVALVRVEANHQEVLAVTLSHGDDELLGLIGQYLRTDESALVCLDAPVICPNREGGRPVDRSMHRLFHREHAGCHPANATRCARPLRVVKRLQKQLNVEPGWSVDQKQKFRIAAEVYPHPAMVRLFGLSQIIKYKRGPVAGKRQEFSRYQELFRTLLKQRFPDLMLSAEALKGLSEPWSKPIEDQLDALFCAVIGVWHLGHKGRASEVIGDLETGFILLPVVTH